MNYDDTIQYLYNQYPVFQHQGATAYKPGLERSLALDKLFDFPHKYFKSIHIGGTNGKGSTSHALAAVLQQAGYKVGLYTSPHLVDFRERIRINGQMIDKDFVIDFVDNYKDDFEPLACSFFELTMMMAFHYFKINKVDIAIIEVGLGGLLDSTNIIHPELAIITNISKDHTQFLGSTLEDIAKQKAGIIKKAVPVVVGNASGKIKQIFEETANEQSAPFFFANQRNVDIVAEKFKWKVNDKVFGEFYYELGGLAQKENIKTILTAIELLNKQEINVSETAVRYALNNISELTGLMGRWQILQERNPKIICDTGHNIAGLEYVSEQLKAEQVEKLHIIIGFANDKDITDILSILPKYATYYFVRANIDRALAAEDLFSKAQLFSLKGTTFSSIQSAFDTALNAASGNDCIFIGGSNFVVGEFLSFYKKQN